MIRNVELFCNTLMRCCMEFFGFFFFRFYGIWSLMHFGVNIVTTCEINHKNTVLDYCLGSRVSCVPQNGKCFLNTVFYVSFAHPSPSIAVSYSI